MRKAAGTTDGVQIPVFFSQFFDIYDPSWYLIESTEADSSSCKTAFCQTQIDAGGTIVGYSYAITTADADGNITGYIYETTSSDANGTYFSTNHYDANWNLTESTYSDGSKISTAEIEDVICYVCSDPCCTEISSEEMLVPNEDVTLVGVSEYNQIDLLLI